MTGTRIMHAAILVEKLIFIGKRHHNIFQTLHDCGYDPDNSQMCPQGFVTNGGKFVDRKEAAEIALSAGQVEQLIAPPHLYSEDLY